LKPTEIKLPFPFQSRAMEVRLIPKKGAKNGTELELADTVGQPVYFNYPNVNAK